MFFEGIVSQDFVSGFFVKQLLLFPLDILRNNFYFVPESRSFRLIGVFTIGELRLLGVFTTGSHKFDSPVYYHRKSQIRLPSVLSPEVTNSTPQCFITGSHKFDSPVYYRGESQIRLPSVFITGESQIRPPSDFTAGE
jgi:hypothetical protein